MDQHPTANKKLYADLDRLLELREAISGRIAALRKEMKRRDAERLDRLQAAVAAFSAQSEAGGQKHEGRGQVSPVAPLWRA